MLQKTLALLHRSLRTDVRLLRVHFFRAGLLVYVLFALSEVQTQSFSGSPGLDLLRWLLHANFWFITLSGILYFSSAITEEKEEQTLGLLKLAGINPLSLLLGKWLPRMIGALLLIIVQFPFTLLSITLGGVLLHQVVAAYCTLVAHLVLCGSIGLFASVLCSRAGAAAVLTLLIMIGLSFLLPFMNFGVTVADQLGWVPVGWIERGNEAGYLVALGRIQEIMQTGFDGAAVGMQVVGNLAVAALFAGASLLLFNRMTAKDVAAIEVNTRWITRVTRIGRRRSGRAWALPLVWKDYYQIAGGGWALLKFIAYPFLILLLIAVVEGFSFNLTAENFGMFMMMVTLWVGLLEVSVVATRVFREEVKAQTWPLLVLLPRPTADTCYGKLAGALLGLAPAVCYFAFGALLAVRESADFISFIFQEADALLMMVYVVLEFFLFWHLATLLSIVWRWAAWPVAIFFAGMFVFVGNMLVAACMAGMGGPGPFEGVLLFLCFVAASLVFVCHIAIGSALERIAGE